MKRPEWQIGDLIYIYDSSNLGVILKIHKKAGQDHFYLVHDNFTGKEHWIHKNGFDAASSFDSSLGLPHRKTRV